MKIDINKRKSRGGRSCATIDGKKVSLRKAEALVSGHTPTRITSGKENDILWYDIDYIPVATTQPKQPKALHTEGILSIRKIAQGFTFESKDFVIAFINNPLLSEEENKANAERMMKTWNMHDELVETLKEFVEVSPCKNGCKKDDMTCITNRSKKLLKQAEQ